MNFKLQPSYRILTGSACRKADSNTIEHLSIDGLRLMEIAGTLIAEDMYRILGSESKGMYICGSGNNGGDALVIARYLLRYGHNINIFFTKNPANGNDEYQKNWDALRAFSQKQGYGNELRILNYDDINDSIDHVDYIVDGLLGTGFNGKLSSKYVKLIKTINQSQKRVYAIDIPSGVYADSGSVDNIAVNAHKTYALGALKLGLYLDEGRTYAGEIKYIDLPLWVEDVQSRWIIDKQWIKPIQKQCYGASREHKYAQGHLYIISGSSGMCGAGVLNAKSAWSIGLGSIQFICPHGCLSTYENLLPEIVKHPMGSVNDNHFTEDMAMDLISLLQKQKSSVVLIGSGLGRKPQTINFVKTLLTTLDTPCVIDADALYALGDTLSNTISLQNAIMTPHIGELKYMGVMPNSNYDRLLKVESYSKKHKTTILSKGNPSIIANVDEDTLLTPYDTRIFNRCGYGDVLSGMVSAYYLLVKNKSLACAMALWTMKQRYDILLQRKPHYTISPIQLCEV